MNLELLTPAGGSPSPDSSREAAQRGNWLLELERAWLTFNTGQPRTAAKSEAPAASGFAAVHEQSSGTDAAVTQSQGSDKLEYPGRVPEKMMHTLSPSLSQQATEARPSGADVVPAGPELVPTLKTSEALKSLIMASTSALPTLPGVTDTAGDPVVLPVTPLAIPAAVFPGMFSRPAVQSILGNASVTALPQSVPADHEPSAIAPAPSALPMEDAGRLREAESAGLEKPAASRAGAAFMQADEVVNHYAPQRLHLYQGVDGVYAWIRDAALMEHQAGAIAQALANEIHASGQKLLGLSLNGKKVARPLPGVPYASVEEYAVDLSQETLSRQDDVQRVTLARRTDRNE